MWLFTTTGAAWGLKENIPTSLFDACNLLCLASIIEA
jgi:hypothetical protein